MEVTVTTAHGCYLLRPGSELNEIFAGCLGRAQALYPVHLHAVVCMSSHFHCLLSPEDSQQLSKFMHHLNTNLSKKVGKLHGWSGSMFEPRYRCIPVSDEPKAQQARLRYLLSHGCKEGLVLSPHDWPGVHSAGALTDGEAIRGSWIDGTAISIARSRGKTIDRSQYRTDFEIHLEPLPCWAHLGEEIWRQYVREMIEEIERKTLAEHSRNRTAPAGATSVLERDPRARRVHEKPRRPPPLIHAASREVRESLRSALCTFVTAYRDAAERLKRGESPFSFPQDCFPPQLPYVPPDGGPSPEPYLP